MPELYFGKILFVKKVLLLFCAFLLSCSSSYDHCAALAKQPLLADNWGDVIAIFRGENPNLPVECRIPSTLGNTKN